MHTSTPFSSKRRGDGLLEANITSPHPIASLQETKHAKSSKQAHEADAPHSPGTQQGKAVLLVTLCTAVIGAAFVLTQKNIRSPRITSLNATMLSRSQHHKKLNFTAAPAPVEKNSFIGRKDEMAILASFFKNEDGFVIYPPITGFDGVGKTQLALKLIEQHKTKYDYTVWINASTTQDIQVSYLQIAEEMGLSGISHKSPTEVVQSVQNRLKGKRVLYVFDDAPNLKTIKPYLKKGYVLITSRNNSKVDWISEHFDAPLALASFSPEEALTFVKAMGQNGEDTDLQELIGLLPRYPLLLRQLFSNMSERKDSPQKFLDELKKQEQTTYQEVLSLIIKRKLDFLKSQANGDKLLLLVKQLACLDAKPIPKGFVELVLKNNEEKSNKETILKTLATHGLMRQGKDSIHMHSVVQTTIRDCDPLSSQELQPLVAGYIDYTPKGFYHQMISHGEKLLAHVEKSSDKHDLAKCYLKLSNLYRGQKDYEKALTYGEVALRLFIQVQDQHTNHADIAYAYNNLGGVYCDLKRYYKAINAYLEVIEPYEAALKVFKANPAMYEAALNKIEEEYGAEWHLVLAAAYEGLASVYYTRRDFAKSFACWQKKSALEQKQSQNNQAVIAK